MENPRIPANYERNATAPGLAHAMTLKYTPVRVSHLCLRSAYLQKGNALAALGREDEARQSYDEIVPVLEKEPRCARIDWERHSLYINIGNTLSRSGDYESANGWYDKAQEIGQEHMDHDDGSTSDGKAMVASSKRSRAFALKKIGRIDEAKTIMREVVDQQLKDNAAEEKEAEEKKKKAEEEAAAAEKEAEKEEEKKGEAEEAK
jgi:tetratricopeptide (TPR) repeat protein